MTTREPAVAGTFYPESPDALGRLVDDLVAGVEVPPDEPLAGAYVVPHAGYRYSGPIAAQVYARLRVHADEVRRVVLIGPAHRVRLAGAAVSGARRWRTPLGTVPVDTAGVRAMVEAGVAVVDDRPHAPEHSLEVQVPFLQRTLGQAVPILPVCVGLAGAEEVAAVIVAAGAGPTGTVLLCSTDFSHYLPDGEARRRDAVTAAAVLELSDQRVATGAACGLFALRGLLRWARAGGFARPRQLALGTSAETGGDPARVVGYPAFAFHRASGHSEVLVGDRPAELGDPV